ncbi:hypothetical protein [Legionella bononiensis]|uniref:Coiled-coil protein n=1 Tax=Legionella bononiensis TaxID=2793102 RepID=A0ABS1W9W9_9GAMM|nr:hypothetical protein [Legionella bononiensis]MBL7480654.1 hypothetical protein [Legionella bononiensis]MBL7526147.1 hypothetical protein [Legionella bononiensis]MBL7563358.1 hypothetical protein [Legionella bononiensis]
MEPDTQNEAPLAQSTHDVTIPENIINLERNLRGLRAEIDVKIHNFSAYEGENRVAYLTSLDSIAKELDSAIEGIETLVGLVNTQSDEEKQTFYQSETMQKFYGIVTEQLNEMSQLRKKL